MKKLQRLMQNSLANEIKVLPVDLQKMLVDDMVTAFQNRFNTFLRITQKKVN